MKSFSTAGEMSIRQGPFSLIRMASSELSSLNLEEEDLFSRKRGFILTDALICAVIAISMCTLVFYSVRQEKLTSRSIAEKMLESDTAYISEIQAIESVESECMEEKCETAEEEKDSS